MSVAVQIRNARNSDKKRFAELLSVFTAGRCLTPAEAENRFRLIRRDPDQRLLIATVEDEPVGLLAFRIRHNIESVSHFGEIAALAVDPAWQKRGVGAQLVSAAENLAKQRKCAGLWLVSGFGREEEAHRFYRRLGFSQTGARFVKTIE